MTYFPMFIKIPEERRILLVGGGLVAFGKLEKLSEFDVKVHLIADKVDLSFYNTTFQDNVEIEQRSFKDSDINPEYIFVIAATNDRSINRRIAELCKEQRIPVNVVDDAELSSFIFPSILKRGSVTAGISSGGKVPVITQYIRDILDRELSDDIGVITEKLEAYREELKGTVPDHKERAALIKKRLDEYLNET